MFDKDKDDEKALKIGKQILHEDDMEFTVTYKNEVFTLRLPDPLMKAQIESEIARRLGGSPRNSFPEDHLIMLEATTYVNNLVIPEKSPDWFKSAWNCMDDNLIGTLYQEYLTFRKTFRERLQGDKFTASR